jgi:hypothetical protein
VRDAHCELHPRRVRYMEYRTLSADGRVIAWQTFCRECDNAVGEVALELHRAPLGWRMRWDEDHVVQERTLEGNPAPDDLLDLAPAIRANWYEAIGLDLPSPALARRRRTPPLCRRVAITPAVIAKAPARHVPFGVYLTARRPRRQSRYWLVGLYVVDEEADGEWTWVMDREALKQLVFHCGNS